MKIAFILPYFGEFPNYFKLYLKSCEFNKDYDWIIITDDKSKYNFPKNVKVIYETFEQLKKRISDKFDFDIKLDRPHKLCDFKPAYGYIFEDILKGYDFWGHCDPDCIFGNLSAFITSDLLTNDKIFTLGHMTLYRNKKEINMMFKEKINSKDRYKEVFTNNRGYAFDEQYNESINNIFESKNIKFYKKSLCADIDPYNSNMRLTIYDLQRKKYYLEDINKQIFYWRNGCLFRKYIKNNKLVKEEFLYIHLQKRAMKIEANIENNESFVIGNNKFKALKEEITSDNFDKYYSKSYINIQYFKTKLNSLKYRINLMFSN